MVDEALIAWRATQAGLAENDVELVTEIKPFPRLKDSNAQSMSQNFATIFIYVALMFQFVMMLIRVVYEKEMHVTAAMRCMGLFDSAYWCSYWVQGGVTSIYVSTMVFAIGNGYELPMFVRTDGDLLFTIFLTYTLSMTALAFLCASVVHRVRVAAMLALIFLLAGAMVAALCNSPDANPIPYMWWEPWWPNHLTEFLSITVLTPLNLCKIISDLTIKTTATVSLNTTSNKVEWSGGSDFTWDDMTGWRQDRIASITYDSNNPNHHRNMTEFQPPPTQQALDYLTGALFFFFLLAWYFNQILPGPNARPAPLWFPVLPSYWVASLRKGHTGLSRLREQLKAQRPPAETDDDVAEEANRVLSGEATADSPVQLYDLHKVYTSVAFSDPARDDSSGGRCLRLLPRRVRFAAVRGVSFSLKENECFALLGHNGAGKTTLQKMITAQIHPTKGDVSIFGLSVKHDAPAVRQFIGICPQHDILLGELSAREHLLLYGQIKGLTRLELAKQVPALIEHVRLKRVQDKAVKGYSGGMKRRVSVAVTFVGDPKVLLLDEPTTGMDPMNRKHVWDMIETLKANRALVLTSHSMEEADALGDRITIQSHGKLIALGDSLHLKHKFGEGYSVKLVSSPACADTIKKSVQELCPAMVLVDDDAGDMTFKLSETDKLEAPKLFKYIQEVQTGKHSAVELVDWGISHTTLEDVFLKLAKGEDDGTKHSRVTLVVRLPISSFTPGQTFDFVGMDGLTYTAQPEQLPTKEKWSVMVEEWRNSEKEDGENERTVGLEWQIRYEKRQVLADKTLANCVRVQLDKPTTTTRMGITLISASPDVPPVISSLNPKGLAALSGRVRVGDVLLAVNSTPAKGFEAPTAMLKAAVGNVVLSLKREQTRHTRVVKFQLFALVKRTILLKIRQRISCSLTLLVPVFFMLMLGAIQDNIIDDSVAALGNQFSDLATAADHGCANITDIFERACAAVVDEDTVCSVSEHNYATQCGCIWNDPDEPYKPFRAEQSQGGLLNPDNCEPGGRYGSAGQTARWRSNEDRPRFHEQCVETGNESMPEWCACSGPQWATAPFRTDNWYCSIDSLFKSIEILDSNPVKILNNVSDRGYMPVSFSGSREYRDNWATYAGWTIAVVGLNVGDMTGHLSPNGWVGTTNFTNDAVIASFAAGITASGFIEHLPRGVGVVHLDDNGQDDLVPVLDRVRDWRAWQKCAAPRGETCCINVEHIIRECSKGCTSNTDSSPGCCGCEEENQQTWRTRRVCASCSQMELQLQNDKTEFYEPALFIKPTFEENQQRATQCFTEQRGCECHESRLIKHNVQPGTYSQHVHSTEGLWRTCTETDGVWTNSRCATVKPALESSCSALKADVASACTSGIVWRHSAPADHVAEALRALSVANAAAAAGTPMNFGPVEISAHFNLGVAVDGGSADASPLLTAMQLALASRGGTVSFVNANECLPPTCYDFSSNTESCSVGDPLLTRIYSELDLIYPCHHAYASTNYSLGFEDATTRGNVAEGRMCHEAHLLMNPPDGNASYVPECNLENIPGHWTQCGSCGQLVDCPEFVHYATPLYQATESLTDVMNAVLHAQMTIRDGGAQPQPVKPVVPHGESRGLEMVFPSVSLEVNELDTSRARGRFTIAGMWGDMADWPYVSVPTDWPEGIDFTNVKFMCGPPGEYDNCADQQRLTDGGGVVHTMQNWISNGLLRASLGSNFSITTALKALPFELGFEGIDEITNNLRGVADQMKILSDLFIPIAASVGLPIMCTTIVMEKEYRLRALMTMMGLQMRWYWLSEWMWNSLMQFLTSVIIFLMADGFDLALAQRSPDTLFALLLLWSQALVALSFLGSVFYNKLVLSHLGNLIAIFALMLLAFITNNMILTSYNDTIPTVFFLCSPFAFFRGIHLLNERTYVLEYIDGEMSDVFTMLCIDVILYYIIAIYLDAVWPREFGVVKHPLFCLLFRRRAADQTPAELRKDVDSDEDGDVRAEREATSAAAGEGPTHPVKLYALRKVYSNGKVAVRNVTFSIHDGECFGLLGPNGAGKTTTISMLTGLYKPTSGRATICGLDMDTQMDKINELMGVCPQFDILWPTLTVEETLIFYLQIKGVPAKEWGESAQNAGAAVDLSHAYTRWVGRLSGGMKRRVSLAISLLGNPAVVFLDEPTTGLDPQTKRAMWSLIDVAKDGRSIVLTTHSMEEADALCGRIGIMAHGKMRCLGTSLHLKNSYGEGYKIDVTHTRGSTDAVVKYMEVLLPASKRTSEAACQMTFEVPADSNVHALLSDTFTKMEENGGAVAKEAGIITWAIRQTSMEEVFLKVARKSEDDEPGRTAKVTPVVFTALSKQ